MALTTSPTGHARSFVMARKAQRITSREKAILGRIHHLAAAMVAIQIRLDMSCSEAIEFPQG